MDHLTSSGLSILLHGVISLPDVTSCYNKYYYADKDRRPDKKKHNVTLSLSLSISLSSAQTRKNTKNHITKQRATTCADPERNDRGPGPPEKSQKIGLLSNAGPDPLENHKRPASNVRISSAR